jgi:aspartyl-tRNA synthetase
MNKYRNNYCGKVNEENIKKEIILSGWIENIRDHGGIIFVDLRDETGTIQLVSNDDHMFDNLTKESTITAKGIIRKRSEDDYNPHIQTGTIELLVEEITILGKAKNVLPFDIKTSHEVSEDLRLKYRYLDLRNKKVRTNINLRADVLKFLRHEMDELGFLEVQTPIITASSPEGARDFLIPSRKFHGKFYALPQAPQVYKELLMVGGVDKYYQIAPCFRDEDTRADRTMEFYQLDFEMAFVEEEDIYKIGEKIFYDTFTHFSNKEVSPAPFKRISYKDAMLKYGTDKPDLRNPLEITDISHLFTNTTFKPFKNSIIRGIKVDEIGVNSNSWFNDIVDYASSIGMPGIGYVTLLEDGSLKGPIDKFLTDEERQQLIKDTNMQPNSVLFFIANKKEKIAAKFAGQIRTYLGNKIGLIDENKFEFCIINDFPMFEYNEEEKKYDFCHNPFSLPKGGIESIKNEELDDIIAYQYDFVCNGYEMSSGALRNYDLECLELAFEKVGYTKDVIKERFQSLYNAFQYGAPPHGGMAPGIDRIIMLLNGVENLREIQAFPTSASGQDNLMASPSEVTEQQLRELHIKIRPQNVQSKVA